MFWNGIIYGKRTLLVLHVLVTMTRQVYIDLIIVPIVAPVWTIRLIHIESKPFIEMQLKVCAKVSIN